MAVETRQDIYNRGLLDGQVSARLDHHDEQIEASNAAQAQMVKIAATLTSTVQTLTEARVTDAATRIALAAAVKESKDQAEAQSQKGWSPITKFSVIIGSVAVIWAILQALPFAL